MTEFTFDGQRSDEEVIFVLGMVLPFLTKLFR